MSRRDLIRVEKKKMFAVCLENLRTRQGMTMKRARVATSLAAFALVSGMLMATAQEVGTGTPPEEEEAILRKVVVTATKRGEVLQDIPMSVSATSARNLKDGGLADIEGLAILVPNLNWGEHAGTTLITIRGSTLHSGHRDNGRGRNCDLVDFKQCPPQIRIELC